MTLQASIIIPTYNRLGRLQQVLEALSRQTMKPEAFEIIVVSDGSADGTNAYLSGLESRVRPIIQRNQGAAAARNRGIDEARAPLIIFLDDDVVPVPVFVAEHVNAHQTYGDDVIILGPMLTPPDIRLVPWVRWEQAMLQKQYDAMSAGEWHPYARQFYTGNTSLARQQLQRANGFDESFRRAEDVELAYRLERDGMRFVFHLAAAAFHYPDRTYASWLNTPYSYGLNDVRFAREKGHSWLLPRIWHEYRYRHPLIRGLSRLCLDRPYLTGTVLTLLQDIALNGDRLGLESVSNAAYSAIFNVRHYQGISDGLGGRAEFFLGMEQQRLLEAHTAVQDAASIGNAADTGVGVSS